VTTEDRYARHELLFGSRGQELIGATSAGLIGLGGLGAHVAQQLAYLGVTNFVLVDHDTVSESNLNRLIGAGNADIGVTKVEVVTRMIAAIQPTAQTRSFPLQFVADAAPSALQATHALFGCVDDDVARLELLKYASANAIAYVDLASDVAPGGEFGGRVVFATKGERCLSCLGELDQHALARAQMTDQQRAADDKIYGIRRDAFERGGPSVVSVNGVVASLAVTEFMMWRTGLRAPIGYLNYRGDRGTVGSRVDPERTYCYYCMTLWGSAVRELPASE
jgi:molybdopterin/thiamine biosynthesis adenylyltransferase